MATNAWTETTPAGSEDLAQGDDRIREKLLDVRERMAVEHQWNLDTTNDGKHKKGSGRIDYGGTDPSSAGLTQYDRGKLHFNTANKKLRYVDDTNTWQSTGIGQGKHSLVFRVKDGVTASLDTKTHFRCPIAGTIVAVYLAVHTAPVGANIKVNILKGASPGTETSVFSGATRAEIAAGQKTGTAVLNVAVASGDYITAKVDQVGSTTAGSDLVIQVDIQE